MAWSRGGPEVRAFLNRLPEEIVTKVLRGSARAAARVVATEVKARSKSEVVAKNVIVRTTISGLTARAVVTVKGQWPRSIGIWQEWGTQGHFISVDPEQAGGRSVERINELDDKARKAGLLGDERRSLAIGGEFVGQTVWHPGAQPSPFMRVSLDLKESDAVTEAQRYITSRVTKRGIVGSDEGDDE